MYRVALLLIIKFSIITSVSTFILIIKIFTIALQLENILEYALQNIKISNNKLSIMNFAILVILEIFHRFI